MKGFWVWPTEPKAQGRIIRLLRQEAHMVTIMNSLGKSKDGLSNAQIDNAVASNSQWRTLWHLRELIAIGFVEYKTELFGDAGKYLLTELGKTALQKINGQSVPSKPALVPQVAPHT